MKGRDVIADFKNLPDDAFVQWPVVRILFGNVSRTTGWRHIKAGVIPAPTLIGHLNFFQVGKIRAALKTAQGAGHE